MSLHPISCDSSSWARASCFMSGNSRRAGSFWNNRPWGGKHGVLEITTPWLSPWGRVFHELPARLGVTLHLTLGRNMKEGYFRVAALAHVCQILKIQSSKKYKISKNLKYSSFSFTKIILLRKVKNKKIQHF